MKSLSSFALLAMAGAAHAQVYEYRKVGALRAALTEGGDVSDGWKFHKVTCGKLKRRKR